MWSVGCSAGAVCEPIAVQNLPNELELFVNPLGFKTFCKLFFGK